MAALTIFETFPADVANGVHDLADELIGYYDYGD